MKPATARHRTDSTARALTAHAKSLGVQVAALGGTVDAVLWLGSVFRMVDWKTPGGTLTSEQARLVANGLPVTFVSTPEQLETLVAEMRKEAGL